MKWGLINDTKLAHGTGRPIELDGRSKPVVIKENNMSGMRRNNGDSYMDV